MKYFTTLVKQASYITACLTILFLSGISFAQKGQTPQAGPLRPNLGTAATYAIFTGGGAINNTGLSKLTGDVGQDGAYAFNGFPPGTYTGTLNRNNSASALAKSDLLTAWTNEASVTCGFVLGVGIVNGQSFDPAVYCAGGASTTTGNITFDAHGDANAIFIVKIAGQLDANAGTHILLANSAVATNIYWFVDGAVNIADNSTFKGVIIARGAITFLGTSSLDGRALATVGAINIAANSMGPFPPGQSDTIIVTHPALGDSIKGGTQNYQITWSGSGITSMKIFEYSLDSGLTWKTIDTITSDLFTSAWNVPDTTSKKALVRITDGNNLRGVSGLFTISSSKSIVGITIIKPTFGEVIIGGTQNYQIIWSGTSIASQKTFEYSLDSGKTWILIGTMTSDLFAFNWNVPDTSSAKAFIRITDANNLRGVSGMFSILSSKSPGGIIVVKPLLAEIIVGGTPNYQILWSGAGITAQKTIELSLDGGLTWTVISIITTDNFTYNWTVPDTASTMAVIRITDKNGLTGKSGIFTITSTKPNGSITITHPVPGEVIDGGTQNFLINFTAINTLPLKKIEYSLDGGVTWNLIGFLNTDAQTFTWANVPNVATTQALIRITDANGVTGMSGLFTIKMIAGVGSINSLTLSGLDNKDNIGNNLPLGISWTYTPDIGTSFEVEYSLDFTATWTHIATVQTSESPSTSWMTPATGSYNPVFIRVTSSLGMSRTSTPFSIGLNASVSSVTSRNGYIISNYPNPTGMQTTFNVVIPVTSEVTLIIFDELGREVAVPVSQHFDAGTYNIPFDASKLSAGMYTYTLQSSTTLITGKLNIIK